MRKLMALALLGLLSWGGPAVAATDPGAFTDAFLKRVTAKHADRKARRDPAEPLVIVYRSPSGEEAFINLHRIFSFCQNAKAEECQQVSTELLDNIMTPLPTARPEDLRIIVRDAGYVAYLEDVERKSKVPMVSAYREPIGDDLYAVLAIDSPKATAMAGDAALKDLELTRDAAWARARANMKAALPPLPEPAQLAKNAVAFQDQEYLASLLVDREAWTKIAEKVGPDLFVTAVSDGFVFVGTMSSGPKLQDFRKTVADDCAAQPRCVSPNIYRFRGGRWVIAK